MAVLAFLMSRLQPLDFRPPRLDFRPPRRDFRPPLLDFRPPRRDFRPPRRDLRPPRRDFRPPFRPPLLDFLAPFFGVSGAAFGALGAAGAGAIVVAVCSGAPGADLSACFASSFSISACLLFSSAVFLSFLAFRAALCSLKVAGQGSLPFDLQKLSNFPRYSFGNLNLIKAHQTALLLKSPYFVLSRALITHIRLLSGLFSSCCF